jgi:hypothetical protein
MERRTSDAVLVTLSCPRSSESLDACEPTRHDGLRAGCANLAIHPCGIGGVTAREKKRHEPLDAGGSRDLSTCPGREGPVRATRSASASPPCRRDRSHIRAFRPDESSRARPRGRAERDANRRLAGRTLDSPRLGRGAARGHARARGWRFCAPSQRHETARVEHLVRPRPTHRGNYVSQSPAGSGSIAMVASLNLASADPRRSSKPCSRGHIEDER